MTSLRSLWSSVSLVFWLFLVLLLAEIDPYAHEPLREQESGLDECESDEENHVWNTGCCQCNHSPDESISAGDCLLSWKRSGKKRAVLMSWKRCTINCKVDLFDQFSVKT